MSIINEIKQKTDILELVGQYTRLTKAGRTYRGLCPFHNEKTPSFFVYPEQQSWHCFGACNTGGDVFAFVMKKQGVGFGDALRFLAARTGLTIPERGEKEESQSEKERLFEATNEAAGYFHELLISSPTAEKARNYLTGRGINLKTLAKFQLGYAPGEWEGLKSYLLKKGFKEGELAKAGLIIIGDDGRSYDRFRNKLMIPVYDTRGRVTGFGARVLDDSLPKYVNSPQTPLFDKSGSLFGIHLAAEAIKEKGQAVIVEGYMDVIIAHQYGFENVVASMGTSITDKQINILKKYTRNLLLALDSDAAGEEAMLRGVNYENVLEAEVKVVLLPEGKDPDEVIRGNASEWQELLNNALPVIDFTFRSVTNGLDLSRVQDKTIAVDKLLPVIAGIENNIRRDHYLLKLAEMTGTTLRGMETMLAKMRPIRKNVPPVTREKETITRAIFSSPVEEYMIALLLQHPELKQLAGELQPEYFENTENREIFLVWQSTTDLNQIRELLDNTIREHFELMLSKKLPESKLEEKYKDCILRLREKYLRNLERKRSQVLALEREMGGTDAELAKLKEQGTGISEDLKTVFTQRNQYRKR